VLATKVINVTSMTLSGGHDFRASYGLGIDATNNVYVGFNKYNGTNYDACVNKYNNALTVLQRSSVYSTAGDDNIGVDMKIRGSSAVVLEKSVSGANTTYSVFNSTVTAPAALYSFAANTDVLNAITTAANKNIFVTGYSLVSGVKVAMTAAINATGGLKWQKTFNHGSATGDDFGSEIMIGADGDIYVSGTTYTNASNGSDVLLMRYPVANGILVWSLFINFGGNDSGGKLADGASGFVYVTNVLMNRVQLNKVATAGLGSLAGSVMYIPIPASAYTAVSAITLTDMKVAASGNAYLCGSITGGSTIGNFNASYLVKISSGLTILATNTVEGNNPDNFAGAGVALDPTTNHVIALRSYWSGFTAHNTEKAYVTSLNAGTLREIGSANVTSDVSQVSFFPNPASGSVYFNSNQTVSSVELSNMTGQIVATLKPQDNMLDISKLKPGLYLAKVITSSGVTVKRIVVN
jgi:Secretion system C-terminal sorting domain